MEPASQLEYMAYSWNDLIKWGTPYPLISVISLYSLILFYLWCVSGHLWGDPSTPIDSFYLFFYSPLSLITGTFSLSCDLLPARLYSIPFGWVVLVPLLVQFTPKKIFKKFWVSEVI